MSLGNRKSQPIFLPINCGHRNNVLLRMFTRVIKQRAIKLILNSFVRSLSVGRSIIPVNRGHEAKKRGNKPSLTCVYGKEASKKKGNSHPYEAT